MSIRLRIIDAFASGAAFSGNPAAVCILDGDEWPDEGWMGSVGAEMRMPMTAFALRLRGDAGAGWGLRWFLASGAEESYCGHATLATASALFGDGLAAGEVRFRTRAGVLGALEREDGAVTLDFPAASIEPRSAPDGLAEALGGAHLVAVHGTGALRDLLVVLADEAAVRAVLPDAAAIAQITVREGCRGVIATAAADAATDADFVSRCFDPADGLDEDEATGSAHTALAPYWSAQLGRARLDALQVSPRTAVMTTEVAGDRVLLTGRAVVVLDGALLPVPHTV